VRSSAGNNTRSIDSPLGVAVGARRRSGGQGIFLDLLHASERTGTQGQRPGGPIPPCGIAQGASPQRVEVIVFHLFVVFFDAPQSALEKSWWPEKARLFSARLDAKSRTDLASIPHISFVVLNPVPLQKLSKLLLETYRSMVLLFDSDCGMDCPALSGLEPVTAP